MALRFAITTFALANPTYRAAKINFFTVDGNGDKTTTLATLFANVTGTATLTNPQVLDSDGKFAAPVYIESAVIANITDTLAPDHDTGIIHTPGSWKGNWATATVYYAGEYVQASTAADGSENIYVVDETHTSGTFATDVTDGKLVIAIDISAIEGHRFEAEMKANLATQFADDASDSETAAAISETNSAADAVSTAADVVLTGLDVVSTNADVVTTNADAVSTNADAASAAASYDSFDDRYLGTKANDPAQDNDGDALIDGALYFNTTNNVMKVYDLGNTTWNRITPTSSEQTNINTVSGISANVTTVAGISANVTTVAGISADVTAVASQVFKFLFDTSTSMADPGSGDIRYNHATPASVTAIAISNTFKDGSDISAFIAKWGDSTTTPTRATLVIRDSTLAMGGQIFTINGAITDNGTWLQIPVAHVSGATLPGSTDALFIAWSRTGNLGATGPGSGDMLSDLNLSDVEDTAVALSNIGGNTNLGFLNKSSWADDEVVDVTLTTAAQGSGKAHVTVMEEVPDTNKTNSVWDIITNDLGFDLVDSAYAVTLTPAETTGDSIEFTLGSGSWAAADIGKIIKNVSASEDGEARIISVASAVATCVITVDFTDTNAIASGDWELYSGEFVSGSFDLGSSSNVASVGTPVQFEQGTPSGLAVGVLSPTKALVTYSDNNDGNKGKGVVLTISGSTITPGSLYNINGATQCKPRGIAILSSTKAVVVYEDASPFYGEAKVMTITGTVIAYGSAAALESNLIGYISTVTVSATQVLVAYRGGSGPIGRTIMLDISGTTITPATPITFWGTNSLRGCSIALLSSTQAMIVFLDNDWDVRAVVITISGSTLTANTVLLVANALTYDQVHCVGMSSTTVLASYNNNNDDGTTVMLSVSGTTITAGSPTIYTTNNTIQTNVVKYSATEVYVFYRDSTDTKGKYCLLTVSGTTITAGTPVIYDAAAAEPWAAVLTGSQFVVAMNVGGNGDAVIVDVGAPLYLTNQHVATISGTDSVDTTFYDDLNSVTVIETLNGQTANYAFSFDPTFTSNVVTGGTFIVIGNGETTTRNIASSLNSAHGGTDGDWYINTNATYASETWVAATTNEAKAALEEAEATSANNMSGTDVNAVTDANWPEFGTDFAVAIILYSSSTTATPSVDGLSFNYDGDVINLVSSDYTIEMPSTTLVRVTAPSSGGPRNARIHVS